MHDRWLVLTSRVAFTPSGEQRVFLAFDNAGLLGIPEDVWESELTAEEINAFDCSFQGARIEGVAL